VEGGRHYESKVSCPWTQHVLCQLKPRVLPTIPLQTSITPKKETIATTKQYHQCQDEEKVNDQVKIKFGFGLNWLMEYVYGMNFLKPARILLQN